ncbi:MAG TPA: hypothetical protein VI385_01940 [Flavisolibacter sp.]
MHWSYTVAVVLSFSIFIAGIIGIFRFADIREIYRPFIYLVWIGCVTEVLNTYFAYVYHNNLAISAIYSLCESLFLLWFFSRLGLFKKRSRLLYLIGGLFVTIWLVDTFLSSHLTQNLPFYFDIIYSFTIVILSITAINNLLFTERALLRNPTFLICIGLLIYFTYIIIQRTFLLYGLNDSIDFRRSVQRILALVNCFSNLVYAVAVLYMHKRKAFTLSFSF